MRSYGLSLSRWFASCVASGRKVARDLSGTLQRSLRLKVISMSVECRSRQLQSTQCSMSLKAPAQELKLLMDHAEQSVNVIAYGEMTD
jgi:hypothetical protein